MAPGDSAQVTVPADEKATVQLFEQTSPSVVHITTLGAQGVRIGVSSWLDFENQDQVYKNQGLRLVDVVIVDDDAITGVWRGDQGSAAQILDPHILSNGADENNESDFQRLNRQRKEAGWELKILRTHPNDAYVTGVWRFRGVGTFKQSTGVTQTLAALINKRAYCQSNGMRLVSVDVK